MEMHSRQSLYEIHGISTDRRRRRSRLIARLLITRVVTFATKVKQAIETELAIRRAMTELTEMDDHMLRDLGIYRGEIEDRLRQRRENVGTGGASAVSNIAAQNYPDLPTVNSPLIVSEGRPEHESMQEEWAVATQRAAQSERTTNDSRLRGSGTDFPDVGRHWNDVRHAPVRRGSLSGDK